jgi:hypothetical protein
VACKSADSYAPGNYGPKRSTPVVEECRMGALLAFLQTGISTRWVLKLNLHGYLLKLFRNTEPTLLMTRPGMYMQLLLNGDPAGRFTDQFEEDWGFSMKQSGKNTPGPAIWIAFFKPSCSG